MNSINQLLYELKNQKMMTWVSISGTALSIFLIMAIFMAERLKQIEIAPMSQRNRIMTGQGIDYSDGTGTSASGMGIDYDLTKKLYSNLDGIERLSYVNLSWARPEARIQNGNSAFSQILAVDNEFWKIYDYNFISGQPFEKEDIEAGLKLVVLTESIARQIFNETDVAGRAIDIDNMPFTVKGVVKDQYPLLQDGNIGMFVVFTPSYPETYYKGIFGNTNVRMLLKEGVTSEYVKQQVARRYEELNRMDENIKESKVFTYHEQPYTSYDLNSGSFGSNNNPPVKSKRIEMALYYTFLLLLPAINLSSMTRSRLRHRISEIGVRRAFGAKKRNIVIQIFTENFIMSAVGGVIGLIFSLIFLVFMSNFFIINMDIVTGQSAGPVDVTPVIWYVFDWVTFFIAIGASFVLNILSATIPAWRASAVEPALAISKSR